MPKKFLYINSQGDKIVIKTSSLNSSGDIYHILAFLALIQSRGEELPRVKICYDTDDHNNTDYTNEANVGTQASRMVNFAQSLNMGNQFDLVKTKNKGSAQNSVRESATRDALAEYELIDQRMTTIAIAKYFEDYGFENTTKSIRNIFSQRNNTRITNDDQKKIGIFQDFYQQQIQQIPPNKPVAVVHYRHASTSHSDQNDLDFVIQTINFLKDKKYHVIVITADSRKNCSASIKSIKENADIFFAPFNLDSTVGKIDKKTMEGSFCGFAKLYHLSLLTYLIEQSECKNINLQGILGTTSGTLDLAAFIGHNVYNLHRFTSTQILKGMSCTKLEYQDARILAQSSFMRIYENSSVLQQSFHSNSSHRYLVEYSDQYKPRTQPKKLTAQLLQGDYRYLTTTGKTLGEKTQAFAENFLKTIFNKNLTQLQQAVQNADIPELPGYNIYHVQADGNCMFNAVLASLNSVDRYILQLILEIDDHNDPESSKKLRNKVVEHIRNKINNDSEYKDIVIQNARATLKQYYQINEEDMSDDEILHKYLDILGTDGEWGDHIALNAIADIFQIQIHVHGSHPTAIVGTHFTTIHLHLHGEVHYDAYLDNTLSGIDQLMQMFYHGIFNINDVNDVNGTQYPEVDALSGTLAELDIAQSSAQ